MTYETSCGAAVVSNLSDRNGEDGNFSGGLVYWQIVCEALGP